MVTKGVASVRSPVQNLRHFNPSITHEAFVQASAQAFQEAYGVDEEVRLEMDYAAADDRFSNHLQQAQYVEETESVLNVPEIRKGMEELRVSLRNNIPFVQR